MEKIIFLTLRHILVLSIFGIASTSHTVASTIFSTNTHLFSADFGGEVTRFSIGGRFENLANGMIDGAGVFLNGNVEMWDSGIEYYILDANSEGLPTEVLASGSGQSAQLQNIGDIFIPGLGELQPLYELTFEFESEFAIPDNDEYVFAFRLSPELNPRDGSIVALGFSGTDNELYATPAGQFNWSPTDGIDQSLSFFFTGTIPEPSTGVLLISGAMLFFRRHRL